jgi:hypothetical protein
MPVSEEVAVQLARLSWNRHYASPDVKPITLAHMKTHALETLLCP